MLELRKHSNGIYYAHGTINGQRFRPSLRTRDKREAEQKKSNLEYSLRNQSDHHKQGEVVFDVAAVMYVEDEGEARFLKPIATHFLGRALSSISGLEIRAAASKLYPNACGATKNRQVITPTQSVINFGHEQGWCPYIKVAKFDETKKVRKPRDRKYIDQIISHSNPWLGCILLADFQTALRIGNTIEIIPDWVDLKNRTINIPKTKNGKPRTVNISKELAGRLTFLQPRNGKTFGYNSRSGVRKAIRTACGKAGLPYQSTHELGRHSFATHFAKKGWNSRKIADAGGWKTTKVIDDIYITLSGVGKEAANEMDKIDKKLAKKNRKGK